MGFFYFDDKWMSAMSKWEKEYSSLFNWFYWESYFDHAERQTLILIGFFCIFISNWDDL